MLFKLKKMCKIQEFIKCFICQTLAVNATNYFFVPVVKYRTFPFILPNEFSVFHHFLLKENVQ